MSRQESVSKSGSKLKDENRKEILKKIQKCQKEINQCRHKCDEKIFEMERRYIQAVAPHLKDRSSLIESLPNFWSNAILQHPLLTTVFEPGEKEVLSYLSGIDIEHDLDNPDYFKIHFFFSPNPYFENKFLTKQFSEEGSASTDIKWKTENVFPKSSKHEIWEYDELGLEQKGFFRWFCDPEEQFCDPIADIIRNYIWHDPLEFYFEDCLGDRRKKLQEIPFS